MIKKRGFIRVFEKIKKDEMFKIDGKVQCGREYGRGRKIRRRKVKKEDQGEGDEDEKIEKWRKKERGDGVN